MADLIFCDLFVSVVHIFVSETQSLISDAPGLGRSS